LRLKEAGEACPAVKALGGHPFIRLESNSSLRNLPSFAQISADKDSISAE
jgi:hypothetical protein